MWSIAFSPDGKFIATSGADFKLFLWDAAEVMKPASFDFVVDPVGGRPPISADGTRISVTSDLSDGVIEQAFWDIPAKKRIIGFSDEPFRARAFSPDGVLLALGNGKGEIVFFNVASGAETGRFKAHSQEIISLAFSPDGRRLLSGSLDETVKIWDTESGGLIRELCRFERRVNTLGISPDGSTVFAAGLDRTAKLFDLETGEIIVDLGERRKPVLSVAFAPRGKTFAIGDADGIIEIRHISDGEPWTP